MTRLIDADAIPWDVEGIGEIPVITKEEIEAMPVVEAIPVEWIKEWRDEIVEHPLYTEKERFLITDEFNDMLEAWAERKEE